eukprot:TRINITY_DN50317_c0_g1_i1.p1 TRINITY_DN50317_c0_g1~~TRINITY_DN50317_c0_g1_i1.p1  ORF type:complete len:527 (+),score=70.40 TRINITY_DN50317_c0_g1_i1:102-1682(+)
MPRFGSFLHGNQDETEVQAIEEVASPEISNAAKRGSFFGDTYHHRGSSSSQLSGNDSDFYVLLKRLAYEHERCIQAQAKTSPKTSLVEPPLPSGMTGILEVDQPPISELPKTQGVMFKTNEDDETRQLDARGKDLGVVPQAVPEATGKEMIRGSLDSLSDWHPSHNAPHTLTPRSAIAEALSDFLDVPRSSNKAYWWSCFWPCFILMSACWPLLQMFRVPNLSGVEAACIDLVFDVGFFGEAMVRFFISPRKLCFLRNPFTIVDVLAALPLFVRCAAGIPVPDEEGVLRFLLLCASPLLRLMKLSRCFEEVFLLFGNVLLLTREVLLFLLLIFCCIVLLVASSVYFVEPRDNIASFERATWLVLVTMSTVGYGDITPSSPAGAALILGLMVLNIGFMAMPVGILGNAFTQVWADRDRILLVAKMNRALLAQGLREVECREFLRTYDASEDGTLSLLEFKLMVQDLRLDIDDNRVTKLFGAVDANGNGQIEEKEMIKLAFPSAYQLLYGKKQGSGKKSKKSRVSRRN